MDQKHERPGTARDSTGPKIRNTNETISHLAREILGTLLAALIFSASVWSSVFGMAGQFGPTLEVGYMLAGVGADGQ